MEQQELASLTDRLFGQILDSLVAVAAFVGAVILSSISPRIGYVALFAAIGYAIFYILFADGFAGGQSYGKRVVHTSVVDATTGVPCTFWQSFIRNLLLTLLGIIDWVFIFGKKRQRLGDKAANTIVIKVPPPTGI
jgi:uncharacterized RDD family membrane protein YckC